MKKSSIKRVATLVAVLLLCILASSSLKLASAQGQKSKATRVRTLEPNVYSPQLYADRLKMKFTLINLPGAQRPGSHWEVSYRLYFIPEAEYMKAIKLAARTGESFSDPSKIPGKIQLAEGSINGKRLTTLKNRTRILNGIVFKAKVPDKDRTKFAALLTSYAIRIYDAQLNSTIYESAVWVTKPFADEPEGTGKAVPRTVIYSNFFVSSKGELFKSQWPREGDDTNWP